MMQGLKTKEMEERELKEYAAGAVWELHNELHRMVGEILHRHERICLLREQVRTVRAELMAMPDADEKVARGALMAVLDAAAKTSIPSFDGEFGRKLVQLKRKQRVIRARLVAVERVERQLGRLLSLIDERFDVTLHDKSLRLPMKPPVKKVATSSGMAVAQGADDGGDDRRVALAALGIGLGVQAMMCTGVPANGGNPHLPRVHRPLLGLPFTRRPRSQR